MEHTCQAHLYQRWEIKLPKAVVISFDRWHAGFLGCYGNPWVDTPHLDELAVRGTVFDQYFAENLSPQARQHAWWTGRFQCPLTTEQQQSESTWPQLLTRHDVRTSLLYDPAATTPLDPQLFSASKAVSLEDALKLDYQDDEPKFVRSAISRLNQMAESPDRSELLWIHAGGLPIDTPSSAYEELYSDDDPSNATSTSDDDAVDEDPDFPRFWRRKRASPRELADAQLLGTGWKSVAAVDTPIDWQLRRDLYSGQGTQWDAWVGRILQAVTELRKSTSVLLIFTAAAGEHLGEHAALLPEAALFEEQIHLPLIVELPLDETFSGRRSQLTQAVDLPATLLDWLQIPHSDDSALDGFSLLPIIREDQPSLRDAVYVGDGEFAGIRTSEFYVRQKLDSAGLEQRERVFMKPEDRWDADDMLRQYVDTADELSQKWRDFSEAIRNRGG